MAKIKSPVKRVRLTNTHGARVTVGESSVDKYLALGFKRREGSSANAGKGVQADKGQRK